MNDELVYALIALGVYWWMGWKGAKAMIRDHPYGWRNLSDQMGLLLMAFITGALMGLFVFLIVGVMPAMQRWWDNGGRIFKDKDGD